MLGTRRAPHRAFRLTCRFAEIEIIHVSCISQSSTTIWQKDPEKTRENMQNPGFRALRSVLEMRQALHRAFRLTSRFAEIEITYVSCIP